MASGFHVRKPKPKAFAGELSWAISKMMPAMGILVPAKPKLLKPLLACYELKLQDNRDVAVRRLVAFVVVLGSKM